MWHWSNGCWKFSFAIFVKLLNWLFLYFWLNKCSLGEHRRFLLKTVIGLKTVQSYFDAVKKQHCIPISLGDDIIHIAGTDGLRQGWSSGWGSAVIHQNCLCLWWTEERDNEVCLKVILFLSGSLMMTYMFCGTWHRVINHLTFLWPKPKPVHLSNHLRNIKTRQLRRRQLGFSTLRSGLESFSLFVVT